MALKIITGFACSAFVFDPALLPAETPYPVSSTDYENINS
jgi:hypothetical protein